MSLRIVPVTFKAASEFVGRFHRHNKPPAGCKFCIGVENAEHELVGVAMCGRPVARFLDDGRTLEINRTCTDGTHNANSCLYGACRAVAKGMGYERICTYTQADETGASLRAAGFVFIKNLPARKSWAESSGDKWRGKRDPVGNGGIERMLWMVEFGGAK